MAPRGSSPSSPASTPPFPSLARHEVGPCACWPPKKALPHAARPEGGHVAFKDPHAPTRDVQQVGRLKDIGSSSHARCECARCHRDAVHSGPKGGRAALEAAEGPRAPASARRAPMRARSARHRGERVYSGAAASHGLHTRSCVAHLASVKRLGAVAAKTSTGQNLSQDPTTQALSDERFSPTQNQRQVDADLSKCSKRVGIAKIGRNCTNLGRTRTTLAEFGRKLAELARTVGRIRTQIGKSWPESVDIAKHRPNLADLAPKFGSNLD